MSIDDGHPAQGTGQSGIAAAAPSADRRFRAGAPPPDVTKWALAALLAAGLAVVFSWATLLNLRSALVALRQDGPVADALLLLLGLVACLTILPGLRSMQLSGRANRALAGGDRIGARVAAAAARNLAWTTIGFAATQILLLLMVQFLLANEMAVSRTFFFLPLIADSFLEILRAFWINIYIFTVAEVLVLIWGLVVAIARLAPGPAGKPIRMLATLYVDVFRGLPAVINVYLVGFGIPLTGLPILKDLSLESFAILALTLTSGAYVAEVYRAGIESIHWSQTAAARSLGLSYMQTLRFVIVPQGVRQMVPPLLNYFIALQKDTALISVIGAIDAFNQAMIIASNKFNLSAVTTVAIIFIVVTIPQARFVDRLTERHRLRVRAGGK